MLAADGWARVSALPSFDPKAYGDFNGDGAVDTTDYAVWRGGLGSSSALAADANLSGVIDAADHQVWQSNYGLAIATDDAPELSVDLLEPRVLAGGVGAIGLSDNDTLQLENADFANSVLLTITGANSGVLTIDTPVGSTIVRYAGFESIDLGGAQVQLACEAGLDDEFMVTLAGDDIDVMINGESGPRLSGVGQLYAIADPGDQDRAMIYGAEALDVDAA